MKILKLDAALAEVTPSAPSRRLAGEVYLAAQRARGVLSEAEAEAERIRAEAESEREQVRGAAVAAGYQEGMAQAARLLTSAALERDRLLEGSERELVRLALAIARQILQREVARDTPVVEIAARSLAEVRRHRLVRIRVHPDDAEAMRAAESRLTAVLSRAPGITLREDSTLSRGGVVVETEGGTVDARIELQLESLRSALEGAMPT